MARKIVAQEACVFCDKSPCECDGPAAKPTRKPKSSELPADQANQEAQALANRTNPDNPAASRPEGSKVQTSKAASPFAGAKMRSVGGVDPETSAIALVKKFFPGARLVDA
jgi:hypothetical protein